jgi:hypothetical protein
MEELEELKALPHYQHPDVQVYEAYLRNRIKLDQKEANNAYHRGKVTTINSDLQVHCQKLEARIFQLEWKKLKEYHKVLQVRKFIAALEYPEIATEEEIAANRAEMEDQICLGLTSSKFVKKKSTIEYKPEKMKISWISCLDLDEETGLYQIDWTQ